MRWIDPSVSLTRIPGDIALGLSFPILWYRLSVVGTQGVSTQTQLLHAVTFVARYAHPRNFTVSVYNTAMKSWLLSCSVVSVLILLVMLRDRRFPTAHAERSLYSGICIVFTSMLFSFALHYPTISNTSQSSLTINILWAFSQYVAVGAMIPQYVLLYRMASCSPSTGKVSTGVPLHSGDDYSSDVHWSSRTVLGIDVLMWAYVGCNAVFRMFYIHHWIWRWRTKKLKDPISQAAAVTQLLVFLLFVFAVAIGRLRRSTRERDEVMASVPGNIRGMRQSKDSGDDPRGNVYGLETILESPEEEELGESG